jgi:hypothetical protein
LSSRSYSPSPLVSFHKNPRHRTGVLLTVVGLSLILTGCFGGLGQKVSYPAVPKGPTGAVAVKALLLSDIEDGQTIGRVMATLTRGNQKIEQKLAVDQDRMIASGSLSRVLIGTWNLRVDVYNKQGELIYAGWTNVLVEESKTTSIELQLSAAPGQLIMVLDISDFDSYELIKGKIIIGASETPELVKEFVREEEAELIVTIDELAPRSHDLRVELYKNTFHSYNCIYQGPWEVITIQPGKTLEMSWHPAWGCIEIIGVIDAPPPSPTDVSAVLQDGGILISWTGVRPVEDDLEAYLVYAQLNAFTGFQLVATVPKTMTSYLYRPNTSSYPDGVIIPIQLAVSSLDAGGNESSRSSPVKVPWLTTGN